MIRTVEAVVDDHGAVRLLEAVQEDEPAARADETALIGEATLAADWNRPEEGAAWSHLQQAP
jgi:hypothetical protein